MKRKIIIIILVTISILILLSVVWFYFIFIRPFPLQKASQIGNLEVKVEKNNSIGMGSEQKNNIFGRLPVFFADRPGLLYKLQLYRFLCRRKICREGGA